jgi:hypothetical protein
MNIPFLTDADVISSSDATLPEELTGPAPRQIPDVIKQGRLYLKNRNLVWSLAAWGLACLLADELPFIQTLALFFLPLAYLLWIGIGLCVLAVCFYVVPRELTRAKRYLEPGEAAFGRVTSLIKKPTTLYNGQPTAYAIVANVEMQHPQTGVICVRELKSPDFSKKSREPRFRVGDVVPVVWFPDQFDSTAQIYDFLEVMPERDLIDRDGPRPLWKTIVLALTIPIFLLGGSWLLYAVGCYSPFDLGFRQIAIPIAFGAIVGLLLTTVALVLRIRRLRELRERNLEAMATGAAL